MKKLISVMLVTLLILFSITVSADSNYNGATLKAVKLVIKKKQSGKRYPRLFWVGVSFIMGRDPVELAKRAKYKPPAMRVRGVCYTKKSPFRYNKVVQANL